MLIMLNYIKKKPLAYFWILFFTFIFSSFFISPFSYHIVSLMVRESFWLVSFTNGSFSELIISYISIPIFIIGILSFLGMYVLGIKYASTPFTFFSLSLIALCFLSDFFKINPIDYLDKYINIFKPKEFEIFIGCLALVIILFKKDNLKHILLKLVQFFLIFKILQIATLYITVTLLNASPINSFLYKGYGNSYNGSCYNYTYSIESNGLIKKVDCPYKNPEPNIPSNITYYYAIKGNYAAFIDFMYYTIMSLDYNNTNNYIISKMIKGYYKNNEFIKDSWVYKNNHFDKKYVLFDKLALARDEKENLAFSDYILNHSQQEIIDYIDVKDKHNQATVFMLAFKVGYIWKKLEVDSLPVSNKELLRLSNIDL